MNTIWVYASIQGNFYASPKINLDSRKLNRMSLDNHLTILEEILSQAFKWAFHTYTRSMAIYVTTLQHSCYRAIARSPVTPSLAVITSWECSQDTSACARDWTQNCFTNIAFAKRTWSINLQPLIHTLLVEKVRTWQLS